MNNSITNIHPDLACEWSDRNLPLKADDVTFGSNKLYWWKGACGHEWQASAKSRSAGEKCPICSGARVIDGINDLQTLKPEIAAEWSDKNFPMLPIMVSVGSHKKVMWRCAKGHEWTASVKSRTINGTGCPYCSHNAVLAGFNDLATVYPHIAAEWSERNYPLTPSMVTACVNRKAWWKCSNGHEWNTLISTRAGGSKCPYCSNKLLLKGFNDFATIHPELATEWSDKNLPLKPDMVNAKSTKKVWWKCSSCGYEWRSLVKSRVKGAVCPVCSERTVFSGYNDLTSTDPDLAMEWDYEKNKELNPHKLSRSSMYSVWWKCPHGHSWKAKVFDRAVDGITCKQCEEEYQSIFPELLITMYAKQNGYGAVLHSDTAIGLPIDVYIPEIQLAIDTVKPTNDEGQCAEKIKQFICGKQNIQYILIPYKSDEEKFAMEIRKLFRRNHIFLTSDIQKDVDLIRKRFTNWRQVVEKNTIF